MRNTSWLILWKGFPPECVRRGSSPCSGASRAVCPAPWWMSHQYEASLEAEAQLAAEEAAEDAEDDESYAEDE